MPDDVIITLRDLQVFETRSAGRYGGLLYDLPVTVAIDDSSVSEHTGGSLRAKVICDAGGTPTGILLAYTLTKEHCRGLLVTLKSLGGYDDAD